MNNVNEIIVILWILFISYWFVAAFGGSKKSVKSTNWWRGASIRLGIIVIALFALHALPIGYWIRYTHSIYSSRYILVRIIGIGLCLVGMVFAVWARIYLGSNWGTPMSLREAPTLITLGPYAYVRHPIYTGFILAMFGSAIVIGIIWLIPFILLSIYFVYSAVKEEKDMMQKFPREYESYKMRTKMLMPFIL